MDKEVKIFLDGQELDFYNASKLGLQITYSLDDIESLGKRSSSISKTITLPATKNNRSIFGNPQEINITGSVDQTVKPNARIEINGATYLKGFLKITSATEDEFKVVIVGDNGDWINKIKGLKVNDLDFSEYDHTYNVANIDLSETTTGALGGLDDDFLVYPLADYGKFSDTYNNGANYKVRVQDRLPALNVKRIIEKIVNNQGYAIVSNFFDSDFFKNLYLPYVGDSSMIAQDELDSRAVNVGCTDGNDLFIDAKRGLGNTSTNILVLDNDTGNFKDPSDQHNTTTYKTTIAKNGYYDLSAKYKFALAYKVFREPIINAIFGQDLTASDATFSENNFVKISVLLKKNGTTISSDSFIYGGLKNDDAQAILPSSLTFETFYQYIDASSDTNIVEVSLPEQNLLAGDEIEVQIKLDTNVRYFYAETGTTGPPNFFPIIQARYPVVSFQVDNRSTDNDGTNLSINPVPSRILAGDEITVNQFLGDYGQLDLIQGVKHLFNLYFKTDTEARTIEIEPRDDFYLSDAIDWSDKLDVSKPPIVKYIGDSYSKRMSYRYMNDSSDKLFALVEDRLGVELAQEEQTIDNQFARDEDKQLVNPLFAATLMSSNQKLGVFSTYVPKFWAEETIPEFSTKFAPRILYYQGVAGVDKWNWEGTIRTGLPSMYSVDDINDNDNSLYFNDTRRSHGLFQKFYRNTHKTINDGRIYVVDMYLTDSDIGNIDLRTPVYIEQEGEGAYYIIKKIVNKPLDNNVSKVELIKTVATIDLSEEIVNNSEVDPTDPIEPKGAPKKMAFSVDSQTNSLLIEDETNQIGYAGLIVMGRDLTATNDDQVLLGKNNEPLQDMALMIGAGDAENEFTAIAVDKEGNFKPSGGEYLLSEDNNVINQVYTEDEKGNLYPVITK